MFFAKDYRRKAREVLSGRWMLAVGTGFVASLLGAYTALTRGSSTPNRSNNTDNTYVDFTELGLTQEMIEIVLMVVAAMTMIMLVCAVIGLIIGGAVSVGYAKFNLNLVDNTNPRFSDLFSQFDRFGTAFLMQFLRGLYFLLWLLLFIIPGIVAMFSYAMAPYILSENPHMSANEAIAASKELMKGNKWSFFCLSLSFIGWDLVGIFTFGIGLLWVNPYREAAYAVFYRKIKHKQERDMMILNRTYQ